MPKASPMTRSFNAGEFSELLEGRVDLDRYPASLKTLRNGIAAPQGPAIGRSGTAFVAPVADETEYSALVPFVFSNEQAQVLEFAQDRIRFFNEDGIQVFASVSATVISAATDPIEITAVGMGAAVGDQVVLSGFPDAYNLNGEIANVTAKSGDDYTLDVNYPDETVVDGDAALVYHVECVYTEAQLRAMRAVQSVDVVYLLTSSERPRRLSRFGAYDWRLEDVLFIDGPYMPILTEGTVMSLTGTANAVPAMTGDTAPSGTCSGSSKRPAVSGTLASPVTFLERSITYALAASEFFHAFSEDDDEYWAANEAQSGYIQYAPASDFVCDGYSVHAALDNRDTSYLAKDFAPSTFTFEGYDGSNWHILDQQFDYVLYEQNKSVFFELDNDTAYEAYRLNISELTRNGLIEPRVRRLVMRDRDSRDLTIDASATDGINDGDGFQSTDVGRLIRLRGGDGAWRPLRIKTVNSTTQVVATLEGEPFLSEEDITVWRLGYWSDTTGWPSVGEFFDDRFWLAGSDEFPDLFAGSVVGGYETFSQTDPSGAVLDDSAVVARLNARKLSRVRWLSSDDRGLIMGTGSEEYSLSAPGDEPLTARNIKVRARSRRGSADVEPVRVDNQTLYVQRSKRTLREFTYVFEADGYKSPSMSQLASHLGAVQFEEMDYAAEPHSLVWVRRGDGTVVCLTYNREENVIGWHQHDFSGAEVESLTVIPQQDQLQDALWLVAKRQVNGQTRRYIERLTRFWDFETELADAHFVDSGLRYNGAATDTVYGLQHLEGEEVYGLVDALPVGPHTVVGGSVSFPFEGENIVVGLGFDSDAVLPRLENGAADGTAQGKVKRIHSVVLFVWRSFGGQIGVWNEQTGEVIYEPLQYPGRFDEFEDIELYTGPIGPITPSPGYDMNGQIAFRRPKESPLPFNVVAITPQLHTQDK